MPRKRKDTIERVQLPSSDVDIRLITYMKMLTAVENRPFRELVEEALNQYVEKNRGKIVGFLNGSGSAAGK